MKKALIAAVAVAALCLGMLVGCGSSGNKSDGPHYSDTEFVQDVGKAFSARNKVVETAESNGTNADPDVRKTFAQTELDILEQYSSAQFEDTHLQELAISYINALKQQIESTKYFNADLDKYAEMWGEAYNTRSKVLTELVNSYGMTVDESAQDGLDELLTNAEVVAEDEAAQKAADALAAKLKKTMKGTSNSIGDYIYKAKVKNDTGVSFDHISFDVMFYAKNGTRMDSTTAYVENWEDGESVVIDDIYCDGKPAKVKVKVDYFEVD